MNELDKLRAAHAYEALLLQLAKPELVDGDHDDTSVIGHIAGKVLSDAKAWRDVLATEGADEGERLGRVAYESRGYIDGSTEWKDLPVPATAAYSAIALAVRRHIVARAVSEAGLRGAVDVYVTLLGYGTEPKPLMRAAVLAALGTPGEAADPVQRVVADIAADVALSKDVAASKRRLEALLADGMPLSWSEIIGCVENLNSSIEAKEADRDAQRARADAFEAKYRTELPNAERACDAQRARADEAIADEKWLRDTMGRELALGFDNPTAMSIVDAIRGARARAETQAAEIAATQRVSDGWFDRYTARTDEIAAQRRLAAALRIERVARDAIPRDNESVPHNLRQHRIASHREAREQTDRVLAALTAKPAPAAPVDEPTAVQTNIDCGHGAVETIVRALLDFHDRIKESVAAKSDDEVRDISAYFRKQAQPTPPEEMALSGGKNFPMPEYDLIAERLDAELGMRAVFKRGEEFFAKNPGAPAFFPFRGSQPYEGFRPNEEKPPRAPVPRGHVCGGWQYVDHREAHCPGCGAPYADDKTSEAGATASAKASEIASQERPPHAGAPESVGPPGVPEADDPCPAGGDHGTQQRTRVVERIIGMAGTIDLLNKKQRRV